jgi:hypothetical protein
LRKRNDVPDVPKIMEIGAKKERSGSPKNNQPKARNRSGSGQTRKNNDFEGNWFDAALKK